MSNPLTAPFATSAMGSLGTSTPINQSATSAPATAAPQLTSAYNNASPMQQRVDKAKLFLSKWKWIILALAAGLAAMFFVKPGRSVMCSNFGIACDTRPLPGGVKGI